MASSEDAERAADAAYTDRADGGDHNPDAYNFAVMMTWLQHLRTANADTVEESSGETETADIYKVFEVVRHARFADGSVGSGYLGLWLDGYWSVEPFDHFEHDAPLETLMVLVAFHRTSSVGRTLEDAFEARIKSQVGGAGTASPGQKGFFRHPATLPAAGIGQDCAPRTGQA
jgi:hypothetical protein